MGCVSTNAITRPNRFLNGLKTGQIYWMKLAKCTLINQSGKALIPTLIQSFTDLKATSMQFATGLENRVVITHMGWPLAVLRVKI